MPGLLENENRDKCCTCHKLQQIYDLNGLVKRKLPMGCLDEGGDGDTKTCDDGVGQSVRSFVWSAIDDKS